MSVAGFENDILTPFCYLKDKMAMCNDGENLEAFCGYANELLRSIPFRKHFALHVTESSKVIESLVEKMTNAVSRDRVSVNADMLSETWHEITNCLLFVKNETSYRDELIYVVVNRICSVSTACVIAMDRFGLSDVNTKIRDCFSKVLFDRGRKRTLLYLKEDRTCIKSPLEVGCCHLTARYYIFLLSCCKGGNDENSAEVMEFFLILMGHIYQGLAVVHEEGDVNFPVSYLVIIKELVDFMANCNFPLDLTANGVTFKTWLLQVFTKLIPRVAGSSQCFELSLMSSVVRALPDLPQNLVELFIKHIMMKKKPETEISAYSEICLNILTKYVAVGRYQKLLALLLNTISVNIETAESATTLDKFDILPQSVIDSMQGNITELRSVVENFAVFNTLLFHFENDCVSPLEKSSVQEDDGGNSSPAANYKTLLMSDLVSHLLCTFISRTRIADYSVPNSMHTKFVNLLQNLSLLLGRFGKAMIKKTHDVQMTECYLRLCLVWGDMQLMLIKYESSPRCIPKQVGPLGRSPTNLVYLHPYLNEYHWDLMVQRIRNFGNDACKDVLSDLVLQKIQALPLLEDEIEGPYLENADDDCPLGSAARYLARNSNPRWLFQKVEKFVHLLTPEDILNLSKLFVGYSENCDDKEVAENFSHLQTGVTTVAVMSCILHNIGKMLRREKLKTLRRAMRGINLEQVVLMEEGGKKSWDLVKECREYASRVEEIVLKDCLTIDEEDHATHSSALDLSMPDIHKNIGLLRHVSCENINSCNKIIICNLTVLLLKHLTLFIYSDSYRKVVVDTLSFLLRLTRNMGYYAIDYSTTLLYIYERCTKYPRNSAILRRLFKFFMWSMRGNTIARQLILGKLPKSEYGKNTVSPEIVTLAEALLTRNSDEDFRRELLEFGRGCGYAEDIDTMNIKDDGDDAGVDNDASLQEIQVGERCATVAKCLNPQMLPATFEKLEKLVKCAITSGTIDKIVDALSTVRPYWIPIFNAKFEVDFCNKRDSLKCSVIELFQIFEIKLRSKETFSSSSAFSAYDIALDLLIVTFRSEHVDLKRSCVDVCILLLQHSTMSASSLLHGIEAMFALCAAEILMNTRTSVFLQLYKKHFSEVVTKSQECTVSENELEIYTTCAHKLEKLTDQLTKQQQHLKKPAAYMLTDLIDVYKTNTIPENVKIHIKNILYHWIDIVDSHGFQHITAVRPDNVQILQQLRSDYERYFKFSGKI